jgi:hypothetical protein
MNARAPLRYCITVVLSLVLVYSAIWFYAAGKLKTFAGDALHGLGKDIVFGSVIVSGFPFSYDITVKDIAIDQASKIGELYFTADYTLSKISISLSQGASFPIQGGDKRFMQVSFEEGPRLDMSLRDSIFKTVALGAESVDILSFFKSIQFYALKYILQSDEKTIYTAYGNEVLLNIEDLDSEHREVSIKMRSLGEEGFFELGKVQMVAETLLKVRANAVGPSDIRSLKIKDFSLNSDHIDISLGGDLQWGENGPHGEVVLMVSNFERLLDVLVKNNIISRRENIISLARSANNLGEDSNDLKLSIIKNPLGDTLIGKRYLRDLLYEYYKGLLKR